MFTTDVSARGVDYPDVSLVLQLGVPPNKDQYIHRIGRTGRAGKDGKSILLISPYEKKFLNELEAIPIRLVPFDAHQSTSGGIMMKAIEKIPQAERVDIFPIWFSYCNYINSESFILLYSFLN